MLLIIDVSFVAMISFGVLISLLDTAWLHKQFLERANNFYKKDRFSSVQRVYVMPEDLENVWRCQLAFVSIPPFELRYKKSFRIDQIQFELLSSKE